MPWPASANPPRPSSFFGNVEVGGRPASTSLPLAAYIGDRLLAEATLVREGEATLYVLHLPADQPETPELEGGLPGQEVTFRVGSRSALQTSDWQDGRHLRLDLDFAAGPDLRATIDDGRQSVERADDVLYTVTIENTGDRPVPGISAYAELPAYTDFTSADQGGSFSGGRVVWPAATVAAGDSLVHHFTVKVRRSAPLTVASLRASSGYLAPTDGELDPNAENDVATDVDALTAPDALPNLAIAYDGLELSALRVERGASITIRVTTRNIGADTAYDPLVRVVAGDPEAGGSVLAEARLGDLAPGANRQISLTWMAVEGATTIRALADPDGELLETRRQDNVQERLVLATRATGPDLQPALVASDLVQSAGSLLASGSVTLEIRNRGGSAADRPFTLELYDDRDGDGERGDRDRLVAFRQIAETIPAGGAISLTLPLETSLPFLHSLVLAEVDAGHEIAETDESNNTLGIFGDCRLADPAASFELREEWWAKDLEVEVTPLVVQLSDDTGDGSIDSRDTPDVVLLSEDAQGRMIVALSGLDGHRLFTYRGAPGLVLPFPAGQLAAADLDGDAVAEIVAPLQDGRLLCLDHEGSLVWTSPRVEGIGERWLGSIAVGDLDGDGIPELAVGRVVISHDGQLLAAGAGNTNRGLNYNYYGPFGSVLVPGANDYPHAVIADLDLDGRAELIAGNTVYRLAGNQLQVVWNKTEPSRLMEDGFVAVGNLDGDPQAEIVYVSSGRIMAYHHNGDTYVASREISPLATAVMPTFWGSAPTLADLDGDGLAEVLVATATEVVALRSNLADFWRRPIGPDFGAIHGLTAFDFDGDGDREVIYLDEHDFYILDGRSGAILYQRANTSKTGTEYPVVADLDGDGRAEILLPANTGPDGNAALRGLHVLGQAGWRGAARVWNQYSCRPGTVLADGTMASPKVPPAAADKTFRVQKDLPPPATYAPNPTLSAPWVGQPTAQGIPITLRIGNGGRGFAPPGLGLRIYAGATATGTPALETRIERGLRPGEFIDLPFLWQAPVVAGTLVTAVLDPAGELAECREDDNALTFAVDYSFQADLEFASATALTLPAAIVAGQQATVTAQLRNSGLAASAPALLALYLDAAGSGPRVAEAALPAIAPGASHSAAVLLDTLGIPAGDRLLWARIDDLGAVAESDENDNDQSVQLTLAAPTLPDLAVETLQITPASPVAEGTGVRFAATLRNRGVATTAASSASFAVNNVELARPAVPPLATGESFSLEESFDTLNRVGQLQATVFVDPADALAEVSEGNNKLAGNFTIAAGPIALRVGTDKLSYLAGQTVATRLTATNNQAAAASCRLLLTLRDAYGGLLATLADQAWSLAPGESILTFAWPVGGTPPGAYSAMAELYQDGTLRKRAVAGFSVAADLRAAATVTPHQDRYEPEDTVEATLVIANASANTGLGELRVRSRILGPAGQAAFEDLRTIAALGLGETTSFGIAWPSGQAAAGSWQVVAEIRNPSGLMLGYGAAAFVMEDSAQTGGGLHGELQPPSAVGRGATLFAAATLTNGGNADLTGLALRAELVDAAGTVVAIDRRAADVPRGGGAEVRFRFATADLAEGDYQVLLWAEPPAGERRLDSAPVALLRGLAVSDAATDEGDAGDHQLTFQVTLSSPAEQEVTVEVATLDGSAVAPADFEASSEILVFAPGETSKDFTVVVRGDLEPEAPEAFGVRLTSPSGALLADDIGVGTLFEEEGCASPNLLRDGSAEDADADAFAPASAAIVRWGDPQPIDGTAEFELRGTAVQEIDLTPFATAIDQGGQRFAFLGFASGGSLRLDFEDAAGQVLASETLTAASGSFSILAAELAAPSGSRRLGVGLQGSGGIFDRLEVRSLGIPTLSAADLAEAEGNAGITRLSLPLGLSCPTAELAVTIGAQDATATAGSDYQPPAGAVTIAAGATTASVDLDVVGDTTDENDESFRILLDTGSAGVVVLKPEVRVTLLDDDGPALLTVADATVIEGDSGERLAIFAVELSAVSGRQAEVAYHTEPGSAGASDFVTAQGNLVFPPGTTRREVAVAVRGDLVDELDEIFHLVLSAPRQAAIADGDGTATIVDDDQAELAVDSIQVFEGDAAPAILTFTVRLSRPSSRIVRVDYATQDDTAVAGSDYQPVTGTLTFAPGELGKTFAVNSIPDLVREGDERFLVLLSQPVEAALGLPEGYGVLADDDGILLQIADLVVLEPASGTTQAQVELSLNRALAQPLTIGFATADGTARAGFDYDAVTTTATFPAGATKVKVNVPIRADAETESLETFEARLVNPPPDAALLDAVAVVSIVDEDLWAINGSADLRSRPGCLLLTDERPFLAGTAWRKQKIALGQNFDKTFRIYLGKPGGADGLVFALQNAALTALGGSGAGIGYAGIAPSLGIELDTWSNNEGPYDHIAVDLGGATNHNGLASLPARPGGATLLDQQEHQLRVVWNAETKETEALLDGDHRLLFTRDLAANDFAGAAAVYYGFTSGTGSSANFQYFCETELCVPGAEPKISIGNAFPAEGTGTNTQANFTLTLSCPTDHPVTVDWRTQDGTAVAGADYEAASGQVVFAPGETSANIRVTVVGDALFEVTETFGVELTAADGAPLRYTRGLATLSDDDRPFLLNGGATAIGDGCFELTPDAAFRQGSAWSPVKADLTRHFDATVDLYLGAKDADGADGVAFAFQNQGPAALGGDGGNIGYGGLRPVVAVAIDTADGGSFDPPEDHLEISFRSAAAVVDFGAVQASATTANVEDGQRHRLRVVWNAVAKQLTTELDGAERLVADRDIVATELAGIGSVYWGLTAATGSLANRQYFCPHATCPAAESAVAIGPVRLAEGAPGSPRVAPVPLTLACPADHPVTVAYATADGSALAGQDYAATTGTITFQPGEISKTLEVALVSDAVTEPLERFYLELGNVSGARIEHGRAAVTILGDIAATLIGSPDLVEGDATGGQRRRYALDFALAEPLPFATRFTYSTAAGTATPGADFVAIAGATKDVPAGATRFSLELEIIPDAAVENDETFHLDLSAPGIAAGRFTLKLVDDDRQPTRNLLTNPGGEASPNAAPAGWVDAQGGAWRTRTFAPTYEGTAVFDPGQVAAGELYQDVDVSRFAGFVDSGLLAFELYGVVRSANEEPADTTRTRLEYRSASGQVLASWNSGEIASPLSWRMIGDLRPAPVGTRTLRVRLQATRRSSNSGNEAYWDDLMLRALGVPAFSAADGQILEGETGTRILQVPVSLNGPAPVETRVSWFTADGSALAGSDYVPAQGTLVFAAGETSKLVALTVNGDTTVEPDESFLLHLTDPVNGTLDRTPATITIRQDEAVLSMADVAVVEGDGTSTSATLTARLSAASALPTYWSWRTEIAPDANAATPGADFVASSGTIEIPAGALQAAAQIQIVADEEGEPNEVLRIVLENPVNAGTSQGWAQVSIVDDDLALGVEDVQIQEGNPGEQKVALFPVVLARAAAAEVRVSYRTAEITATAGTDFLPATGQLVFAPGETRKFVSVAIVGDAELETSESFSLQLSQPINGRLGRSEGFAWIVDDDACSGPQLVRNWGFENFNPLTDWQASFGMTVERVEPSQFGTGHARSNATVAPGATFELRQTVPLAAYAELIDRGDQRIGFQVFARSAPEAIPDSARARIEFLDAAQNPLSGHFDSGEVASVLSWSLISAKSLVPKNTRFARIRLIGKLNSGTSLDTRFDSVDLRFLDTPILTLTGGPRVEGDAGVNDLPFYVRMSCVQAQPIAVDFATKPGGSATEGIDYDASATAVTFAPGETLKVVGVPIHGDTAIEPNETVLAELKNSAIAYIAGKSASSTLYNDDFANANQAILIGTVRDFEDFGTDFENTLVTTDDRNLVALDLGADGKPVYQAGVHPTITSPQSFAAWYNDRPGLNLAAQLPIVLTKDGSNYRYSSSTFFPIDNQLFGNDRFTNNFHFTYEIHSRIRYNGGETFTFSGDDDVWVFINKKRVIDLGGIHGEQGAPPVRLDDLRTTLGLVQGNSYDFDFFFAERHTAASNFTMTTNFALDAVNPGQLEFTAAQLTVSEADSVALIGVRRVGGADGPVSVEFATLAGGTATADVDYRPTGATVFFASGETGVKTVAVPILQDALFEDTETVRLGLRNTTGGAELGLAQATLSILDDRRRLAVADETLDEGNQGRAPLEFTVRLDRPSASAVRVSYATVPGSATHDDFVPVAGILDFAPGETAKSVEVDVVGDLLVEDEETFELHLSSPVGAEIADGIAIGTIGNDDTLVCDGPNLLANGGAEASLFTSLVPGWTPGNGAFQVLRTSPLPFEGQAFLASGNASAELSQEVDLAAYAVRIDAGLQPFVLRGHLQAPVPSLARLELEFLDGEDTVLADWQSEWVTAGSWTPVEHALTAPEGARFARLRLVATAGGAFDGLELRSLAVPVLTIDDVQVSERTGRPAPFTLALSCPLDQPVVVSIATADGSALAGADYLATSGVRTFGSGETRAPFWVPIVQDGVAEPTELFGAHLFGQPAGLVLLDGQGEATLFDADDAAPDAMTCEDARFATLPEGFVATALGDAELHSAETVAAQLQLAGTGSQLYHLADNTAFYWREANGDFRVEVDIESLPQQNASPYRKLGLMLRDDGDPQAARVMVEYIPDFPGGPALQFDVRQARGQAPIELASTQVGISLPVRVAMVKRGQRVTVLFSTDHGANWVQPLGAKGGSAEITTAEPVEVGANVTSYDVLHPITGAFDDFRLCRGLTLPPAPQSPCDGRPLDAVFLVDVSGSMKRPHGATAGNSRLDSARDTLVQVLQGIAARGDGSRVALIVTSGNGVAANNLANGARLVKGLDAGMPAVLAALQQLDDAPIVEQASSPAAIALQKVLELLVAQRDPSHRVVLVWGTDNLGNVDAAGRGPRFYTDAELQAVSLQDGAGFVSGPEKVIFQGNFNPTIFTYDGQAVADAMVAAGRLMSTEPLRTYALVPRGDGSPDKPILREDLVAWMAARSGGEVFGSSDREGLLALAPPLLEALSCTPQP